MKPRRPLIAAAVVIVVALGAIFGVGLLKHRDDSDRLVASGTVEATEAQLGFQAAGRIEEISAREGDSVREGTELARLDRAEALARRNQAVAQAAAAQAQLQELEHGSRSEEVAQARAGHDAARQRAADARRDLDRATKLLEGGAVSREAFDKARLAFDVAQSQLEQAGEQLRLVETGPRKEKIDAQRAQLAQAQAYVQAIDAALANMTIRASFDGIVTVRHREPGEVVPAGSAVLTVMNPGDRWVRIYIPEDRIGAVSLGRQAVISSDTYPAKTYHGEVVVIASEAEFTPKTVQTAQERVKLVYAVKVRITGDPDHELKPGMPADVRIESTKP